jgi:hypothetical protein
LKELKELKPGICVSSAVESMEYVLFGKENLIDQGEPLESKNLTHAGLLINAS